MKSLVVAMLALLAAKPVSAAEAIDVLSRARTPLISSANTAAGLTAIDSGGYYFRTAAADVAQGPLLAKLAGDGGATTVSVLYQDSAYGKDVATAAAEAARQAGLDVVALTDHDSTAGWAAAAAAAVTNGLALVPGMEVSCRTEEGISVHLLSYLHDPTHPGLLEEITKAKDSRLTRAERMVTILAEDYPLTWDDVMTQLRTWDTAG